MTSNDAFFVTRPPCFLLTFFTDECIGAPSPDILNIAQWYRSFMRPAISCEILIAQKTFSDADKPSQEIEGILSTYEMSVVFRITTKLNYSFTIFSLHLTNWEEKQVIYDLGGILKYYIYTFVMDWMECSPLYIFIIGILRNKYSKHSYLDSIEAIKVSSKDDGSIRHRTFNFKQTHGAHMVNTCLPHANDLGLIRSQCH